MINVLGLVCVGNPLTVIRIYLQSTCILALAVWLPLDISKPDPPHTTRTAGPLGE